jgi:hypothetical protein
MSVVVTAAILPRFRTRQYPRAKPLVLPLTGAIVGVLPADLSVHLDPSLNLPTALLATVLFLGFVGFYIGSIAAHARL